MGLNVTHTDTELINLNSFNSKCDFEIFLHSPISSGHPFLFFPRMLWGYVTLAHFTTLNPGILSFILDTEPFQLKNRGTRLLFYPNSRLGESVTNNHPIESTVSTNDTHATHFGAAKFLQNKSPTHLFLNNRNVMFTYMYKLLIIEPCICFQR